MAANSPNTAWRTDTIAATVKVCWLNVTLLSAGRYVLRPLSRSVTLFLNAVVATLFTFTCVNPVFFTPRPARAPPAAVLVEAVLLAAVLPCSGRGATAVVTVLTAPLVVIAGLLLLVCDMCNSLVGCCGFRAGGQPAYAACLYPSQGLRAGKT